MIRNDNPDKGTETKLNLRLQSANQIRNDSPDKGTETKHLELALSYCDTIRNDNPDKGTETDLDPANGWNAWD